MDERLLPKYGATVAFEHRDFPLAKHKWAKAASIACRYLDSLKPETGVAFRRWVMANQTSITSSNFEAQLLEWAKLNAVDPALLRAALSDAKLAKLVDDDYEEGVARGVARTPTVFVNGEPFIETFTADEISKSIDTALAASKK
ncbi:MAG: thioredoxin domain-containing protein [Bryobacteraceae bacterium]|nr:thioredoxin domain-containing protein [Bryobacteraceae bacterium]